MHELAPRRWYPGFIALRWRHLFWGLPLLGLLAGLVVHFLPMIRGTATGVVQIRPIPSSTTGTLPAYSDVARMVTSEEVLLAITRSLDLPRKWRIEEEACLSRLRGSIRCKGITGTSLLEVRVKGAHRAEAIRIWEALIKESVDQFSQLAAADHAAEIAVLNSRVEAAKADVEAKRETLATTMHTSDLLHLPGPPGPSRFSHYFPRAKAEFDAAQTALEAAQVAQISARMQSLITANPLIIHQAPGTPAPATLWDTLRPLLLHSSIGLGAGILLAVVLAYLLELLFPRKFPTG